MVTDRRRLTMGALALVVLAWAVAEARTGGSTGLLYLAPALLLCVPLVMGRYVGEQRLAVLCGGRPARVARRAPAPLAPRSHVRVMQRGGRLVASAMAKRPPPARALHLSA